MSKGGGTTDCVTQAEAWNTSCPSGTHPEVQRGKGCPVQFPYTVYCASEQSDTRSCCMNLSAANQPSCQGVNPKTAACDYVLGNPASGFCFSTSTSCPSNPNPSEKGSPLKTCPVMTSLEPGAALCRTWCDANPEACNAAQRAYCSAPNNVSTMACSCVAPQGTDWGHLSYADMQAIVDANPKVQKQIDGEGSGAIDIACVWPPCNAQKAVMRPRRTTATSCPQHIDNLCVNLVADVQFSNVVAGKITVGECIDGGTGTGASSQVDGGVDTLPFATQLSVYLRKHPMVIVVTATIFTVILASLLYLAFRPPTTLQLAEAEMTMAALQRRREAKINLLMDHMLGSNNAEVHAAGGALLARRRKVAATIQRKWQREASAIDARIKELRPYATRSAQAGMQIAGLQAEADAFRQQARKLQHNLGITRAERVLHAPRPVQKQ